MKQSPYLKRVQHEMRPGLITRDGFMGTDHRTLQEILETDHAAVQRLGLTHKEIAARMSQLRDMGEKGLGEEIAVPPNFEIRVDSVRGKLPCPFLDGSIVQKLNTTVRNTRLNREVTYTDLNIHMIAEHGFYEGHGSPFRASPEDLVAILEIEPPPQSDL